MQLNKKNLLKAKQENFLHSFLCLLYCGIYPTSNMIFFTAYSPLNIDVNILQQITNFIIRHPMLA